MKRPTTRLATLGERLNALEVAADDTVGLIVVATIAAALSRPLDDITAIAVLDRSTGERRRVDRRPGESVEELHRRANPQGTGHAAPKPIFKE